MIIRVFLVLNVLSCNWLCTLPVPSSFYITSITLLLLLFSWRVNDNDELLEPESSINTKVAYE